MILIGPAPRYVRALVVVGLMTSALVVAVAPRAFAGFLSVNSLADTDDGHCDAAPDCTLREAINAANATSAQETIVFQVGPGTPSIAIGSALPVITMPLIIEGLTGQSTRIELNGAGAGLGVDGLIVAAGGTTISRLVINRFSGDGIRLDVGGNVVHGCFIGTNADGTAPQGNGRYGVELSHVGNNIVGGVSGTYRNVISGNGRSGVFIDQGNHNVVEGNRIGTDAPGKVAIPNGGDGIQINGGRNNTIGGTGIGSPGNLIAGNNGDGILIERRHTTHQATGNVIQGNLIGTNVTGKAALGNSIGIHIAGQPSTVIGGTSTSARNVVSGNATGIALGQGTQGTVVRGNFVGTDVNGTAAIPNQTEGIMIEAGPNMIGGTDAGSGNVVAFNGTSITAGNGVLLTDGSGVTIQGNSLLSNSLLGIDLGDDGVTANDPGDADTGPNDLQNFPVLSTATSNGTTTHLTGRLSSTASATFLVEFFSSAPCDPSGNGEGGTFMGSVSVPTDGSGLGPFDVVLNIPTTVGRKVTSTATAAGGSTSELSKCRSVVAGP